MSFLVDLVSAIKTYVTTGSFQAPQKSEVLTFVDMIEGNAKELKDLLTNSPFPTLMSDTIAANPADPICRKGISAYKAYVGSLSGAIKQKEQRAPFSSIVVTLVYMMENLNQIQDKFLQVFDAAGSHIEYEDMKLSTLVAMGYLSNCNAFLEWVTILQECLIRQDDDLDPPPYRLTFLLDNAPATARFAMMSDRFSHEPIVQQIEKMRREGKDLYITANGQTIDQYGSDAGLDDAEREALSGVMRNPLAMYLSWREERRQKAIEKIQSRMNWLRAKATQVSIRMNNADPHSEEYKQAEKILTNISDKMSSLDKSLKEKIG